MNHEEPKIKVHCFSCRWYSPSGHGYCSQWAFKFREGDDFCCDKWHPSPPCLQQIIVKFKSEHGIIEHNNFTKIKGNEE